MIKAYVPQEALNDFAMLGELALSGEVQRVGEVLPIAMAMRDFLSIRREQS